MFQFTAGPADTAPRPDRSGLRKILCFQIGISDDTGLCKEKK